MKTTRHVITGGVVALLENREQFDALKSDFSRIPTAVEEMLRWVTPVKTIARKALNAVELGGQKNRCGRQAHHPLRVGQPGRFSVRPAA